MPRMPPPPLALALTVLRSARGWSQKELSAATGLSRGILSEYESGKTELSRERLEGLATVLGWRPGSVDRALSALELLELGSAAPGGPLDPDEEDWRIIERAVADAKREVGGALQAELTREVREERIAHGRGQAAVLWERLKPLSPRERRLRVTGAPEHQDSFLCELLCAESERAAASDARVSQELAQLALEVAERIPGPPAWRSRVQGYAWAFIGNARRVASQLPAADAAFARFHELWEEGAAAGVGLFDEARLLDLEASLRRAQRRLPEALTLHDRALATAGQEAGYILVNKANVQEDLEDYRGALATLKQAESLIQATREPRLAFALRFNQAVHLLHLGQLREAEPLLAEARDLAVRQGYQLDLIRVVWLTTRVAADIGRKEEAMAGLEQVRREFRARELAYDYALASLELAVLWLEQGRTADVRAVSRQMMWIFESQGVHREALAALGLFREAAEREDLTLALARRLLDYLEKARRDPGLRFDLLEEP